MKVRFFRSFDEKMSLGTHWFFTLELFMIFANFSTVHGFILTLKDALAVRAAILQMGGEAHVPLSAAHKRQFIAPTIFLYRDATLNKN